MGLLPAILGTSAGIAAHQQAPQVARADTPAAQQPAAAANAIGQAAVVTLSASSKNRAASSGSNKQVDGAFDKQEIKEKNEKKKESDSSASPTVKVSA